MGFRVKQTPQADFDLDVILEWLLEHEATDAGLRWFQRLKDALESLSEASSPLPARPGKQGHSF